MVLVIAQVMAFLLIVINGILMGKIDKSTRYDSISVKYTFLSQISTAGLCAGIIILNLIYGLGLR